MSRDSMLGTERAVETYLSDLLEEPAGDPPADAAPVSIDQFLGFEIGGIRFALPAQRVTGQAALPELHSAVPGVWLRRAAVGAQAPVIIDLALLVLPEDLAPMGEPLASRCDRMLCLDDGSWGLAVAGTGGGA